MKTLYQFASLALLLLAASIAAFSQPEPQTAKPFNLVRGVVGPLSSSSSWSGYSAVGIIYGAGVIPNTSKTTTFYLGFTGGAAADISNMVLYTTARNSLTITAVTPVTLAGSSHPSINLSSKTVCAVQPLSSTSPCVVRLDPITLALSAISDYYLVVYYTANDSNNAGLSGAAPSFHQSSLNGWYTSSDQTHLTVGQSIPNSNGGNQPNFLWYVMNN